MIGKINYVFFTVAVRFPQVNESNLVLSPTLKRRLLLIPLVPSLALTRRLLLSCSSRPIRFQTLSLSILGLQLDSWQKDANEQDSLSTLMKRA